MLAVLVFSVVIWMFETVSYPVSAAIIMVCSISCEHSGSVISETLPPIWPDYFDVTIPNNIAPLNFGPEDGLSVKRMSVVVQDKEGKTILRQNGANICFPIRRWHKVLRETTGSDLLFTVGMKTSEGWTRYKPFQMHVSSDQIDYGLTFRLIPPGYQSFGHMGIYERNLSNFNQRELLDMRMVDSGCINCHTQNRTDPSSFSLHVRGAHSATILRHNGKTESLNTVTDSTGGFFVYPFWHPSGRYITYSTNVTKQSFYTSAHRLIEGYDEKSDVIVYNVDKHTVLRPRQSNRKDRFETWPSFSADGKSLYYSSSKFCRLPRDVRDLKYSLCRLPFDPETGSFGEQVDTILNAEKMDKSFSLPRPSYDGKYLLITVTDFGTLQTGHKEADLWLYDNATGAFYNAGGINSENTESFHNWNSTSKWAVVCSRRDDGLYTRLYLAHLNENGVFDKGFMLPQKNPCKYYSELIYSYNTPDFTSGKVPFNRHKIRRMIMSPERQTVEVESNNQ